MLRRLEGQADTCEGRKGEPSCPLPLTKAVPHDLVTSSGNSNQSSPAPGVAPPAEASTGPTVLSILRSLTWQGLEAKLLGAAVRRCRGHVSVGFIFSVAAAGMPEPTLWLGVAPAPQGRGKGNPTLRSPSTLRQAPLGLSRRCPPHTPSGHREQCPQHIHLEKAHWDSQHMDHQPQQNLMF